MIGPKKRIALLILVAGVTLFELILGAVVVFGNSSLAVPGKADAVIVLGAKVGTPALTHRTLTGLSYVEQGKTDTMILSGGRGSNEPVSEARAMAAVVKARVAATHGRMPRLILETHSTDTFQNLANSRALLPTAKGVIVVTDGYHLARSVAIARHDGFEAVYWNAPKPVYYKTIDLAHYYVREAVALIVYAPRLI